MSFLMKQGSSKATRESNTEKLIQEGKPPKQAVAIAYSVARRGKKRKAKP